MALKLTWSNMVHQKKRTLVGVAGVTFAIVLIFMQLGFFGAVVVTATRLYERLDFDVIVLSADYLDINRASLFPRTRLYQAQTVAGVAKARPLYLGFSYWRNPHEETGPQMDPYGRKRRGIMMIGFNLSDPVFNDLPEVEEARVALQENDTLLMDRLSRKEFGRIADGEETELSNRRVRVIGHFTIGTGFGADGLLIMSAQNFARVLGGRSLNYVSLGLIQVKPGVDPKAVAAELRKELPKDVKVFTRDEIITREKDYWVNTTSLGTIFYLGVLVAMFVGVVFLYQVMSSDIAYRLKEYATLKALGYHQRFLSGVVLRQSLLYAVFGYVPGLALALILYEVTQRMGNLPIGMTPHRVVMVFVAAVAMCCLSGLMALRKLRKADPADLF